MPHTPNIFLNYRILAGLLRLLWDLPMKFHMPNTQNTPGNSHKQLRNVWRQSSSFYLICVQTESAGGPPELLRVLQVLVSKAGLESEPPVHSLPSLAPRVYLLSSVVMTVGEAMTTSLSLSTRTFSA